MPVRDDSAKAPDGRLLLDDDARVLARFTAARREGRPLADLLEPDAAADEATLVDVALRDLAGWLVAAPPALGRRLVAPGGRPGRHAHMMRVRLDRPPPVIAPGDVRIVPFAHSAEQLAPAWMAAYAPGHPDLRPGEDELPGALAAIEFVADNPALWPLLSCSRVAEDADSGRVVGAALINDAPPRPPFGGAWLSELFRDPGRRGVGAALLRSALYAASEDGHPTVALAVTDGNPARRLYDAVGFRVITSALNVEMPERP